MIEDALRRGIPARAEIVAPEDAKYYLDLGVRHFNLNVDLYREPTEIDQPKK